jgi:hypothetical protein
MKSAFKSNHHKNSMSSLIGAAQTAAQTNQLRTLGAFQKCNAVHDCRVLASHS